MIKYRLGNENPYLAGDGHGRNLEAGVTKNLGTSHTSSDDPAVTTTRSTG